MTTADEERIKRLLFSAELDLLQDLSERTHHLDRRVGDDSALRDSTQTVIVEVLREAGIRDHRRLARVLAPLVLASMREEIRRSKDMMVDALYPITGRLVSAAVRNAFRDLLDQLNERLDRSVSLERWRIWLEARRSGRSEAELLLQRYPPFQIDDLLVIHRPTGLLIARAEGEATGRAAGEGIDSDLMSGMLTAIMSFARDALGKADGDELRQLEFGGAELFLRSSPVVILVVKARGTAPAGFESALEALFLRFLARWGDQLRGFDGAIDDELGSGLLEDLREQFARLLAAKRKNFRRPSRLGTLLAALLLLLLLAGGIGYGLEAWRIALLEDRARAVVQGQGTLVGYPLTARWEAGQLWIEGLLPDALARDRLLQALERELPDQQLGFRTSLLSEGELDRLTAQVGQLRDGLSGLEASLDAALTAVQPQLRQLEERASLLDSATGGLEQSVRKVERSAETRTEAIGERLSEVERATASRSDEIGERLEQLVAGTNQLDLALKAAVETVGAETAALGERASALGTAIERLERDLSAFVAGSDSRAAALAGRIDGFGEVTRRLQGAVAELSGAVEAQAAELSGRVEGLEALSGRIARAVEETTAALGERTGALGERAESLEAAVADLQRSVGEAVGLIGTRSQDMTSRTEALKSAAARLEGALDQAIAAARLRSGAMEQRIGGLESGFDAASRSLEQVSARVAELSKAVLPSPLERLRLWTSLNAVFFVRNDEFRDPDQAQAKLLELARLLGAVPSRARLRLIGYADPLGSIQVNQRISLGRAERVARELEKLGVPAEQLVTVGRADEGLIVGAAGPGTDNRRVEFDVIYWDESILGDGDQ